MPRGRPTIYAIGMRCAFRRLCIRHDHLEERLLDRLQSEPVRPEVIDYAVGEFGRHLRAPLGNLEVEQMRKRKQEIERTTQNVVAAIEERGHSSTLLEKLAQHECDLRAITEQLLSTMAVSVATSV